MKFFEHSAKKVFESEGIKILEGHVVYSPEEAMEVAFGKRPLAVRRGGSIPIISTFERVLGIKTVLMGFGVEQNAIHSPNESCSLDFFYKGIESERVNRSCLG